MTKTSNTIKLNNVRLSYPSIFTPKAWSNSTTKPKYEATFILDKDLHKEEVNLINAQIDSLLTENKSTRNKIKGDHLCLKDGDQEGKEEYKNSYTIKAKSIRKVPIIGKDGITPINEEDKIIYGGCYVSAYITLWIYSKPSMGIGAMLDAIQFRKDGALFENSPMNVVGAFDPVSDEYADMF